MYNIVMFAYNEQDNIATSIRSIFDNKGSGLHRFYLIANGCTDGTVKVASQLKKELAFHEFEIVELQVGDKCNAWNHYQHKLAETDIASHFFTDADVRFSDNCFEKMNNQLTNSREETVAIAGFPLSGRNIAFYQSLITDRACFFGNLYGLKGEFIKTIKSRNFRLPLGLNWIDSFLTKAVNTDLNFFNYNLPNRVTYLPGVGYSFDSLSIFKAKDIRLYLKRIARYELGKIQEVYLDNIDAKKWPESMHDINQEINKNFSYDTRHLSTTKRYLVRQRLAKLLGNNS